MCGVMQRLVWREECVLCVVCRVRLECVELYVCLGYGVWPRMRVVCVCPILPLHRDVR